MERASHELASQRVGLNEAALVTDIWQSGGSEGRIDAAQFEPSKLFFHADRVLRWLAGDSFPPVTLELDLTLACNDRCPYCPHAFAHQSRFLAVDVIQKMLDEAALLGVQGVTITGGGEPLMHPKFAQIISLLRGYTFSVGLITNGGALNAEIAANLVTTCDWIRVSLDAASESSFQEMRGRAGLSDRLKRIGLLVQARQLARQTECELGLSFLTCAQTSGEIPKAAEIARQLEFDYIQLKPMVNWVGVNKHLSPLMGQRGVIAAVDTALHYQTSNFDILVSTHRYDAELLSLPRHYSAFHCAWFVIAVGPSISGTDGKPSLYLDCSSKYVPSLTIGSFDSLADVLQSDRRKELILNTSSEHYCVPSEKHAVYNSMLDDVLQQSRHRPVSREEIKALSPTNVKHPYSL